jgi:hypothetical protein
LFVRDETQGARSDSPAQTINQRFLKIEGLLIMINRTYRSVQMHRIPYTDLTESQVLRCLGPAAAGPGAAGPLSQVLAGRRLKIVTDGGPALEYNFRTERELEFTLNGAKTVKAGYGAQQSGNLVLLSHWIPDSVRGFNLVIDQKTGLVTVFELYFNGYAEAEIAAAAAAAPKREPNFQNGRRNREVQRNVWFGYVDGGGGAPKERHTYTNRLEGKGIYWKQDNDIEILEFYTSIIYSSFIELTRFGGEMLVCSPSDYVMINEHQYIYSRIETEFSGTYTLEVVDLFNMTQKGVRLGLNDKDELEYYMYSGSGKVTGQIASFEVFGDNSETRGARNVYRPFEQLDLMTEDEVREVSINNARALGNERGSGTGGSMAGYKTELVSRFVGRTLSVQTENGPSIEYDFTEIRKLKWRYTGDANWREAWYEMYEVDAELYMFAHLLDAEFPRACATVCFDMKNGLATIVKGWTGTPFHNTEISAQYYFGTCQAAGAPTPPAYIRHGWTKELVGKCVTWNYMRGNPGLTSMQFYATAHSYSWIIFQPDGSGGLQWSAPGWFAKLRDGVYLCAWSEEAGTGTLGVICYNERTMHDAGFYYDVNRRGLALNVIGARARNAGKFEIAEYLGMIP